MPDGATPFTDVYEYFFSKITDDYYMQTSKEQTQAAAQDLLLSALHWFEFPRVSLDCKINYDTGKQDPDGNEIYESFFTDTLNSEEKNILGTYMVVEWLGQQLATVELVRMKYSGADFKFTSQANHLQKLNQLRKDYISEGFHLQRLYKRRVKDANGVYHSTFDRIMEPINPLPKDTSLYPDLHTKEEQS